MTSCWYETQVHWHFLSVLSAISCFYKPMQWNHKNTMCSSIPINCTVFTSQLSHVDEKQSKCARFLVWKVAGIKRSCMSNANIIWHTVVHLANNVGLQINLMSTCFLLQRCLKLTKKKKNNENQSSTIRSPSSSLKGGGTACNVNSHAMTDDALFITAYLAPLSTLNIFCVNTDHIKRSWKMNTWTDQQCANKLILNHEQSLDKETCLCQDKNGTLTWGRRPHLFTHCLSTDM